MAARAAHVCLMHGCAAAAERFNTHTCCFRGAEDELLLGDEVVAMLQRLELYFTLGEAVICNIACINAWPATA